MPNTCEDWMRGLDYTNSKMIRSLGSERHACRWWQRRRIRSQNSQFQSLRSVQCARFARWSSHQGTKWGYLPAIRRTCCTMNALINLSNPQRRTNKSSLAHCVGRKLTKRKLKGNNWWRQRRKRKSTIRLVYLISKTYLHALHWTYTYRCG